MPRRPSPVIPSLSRDLEGDGVPVETLMLAGVTHGFDQEERAALSTLVFDEAATAETLARGMDFLAKLGPGLRTAR